MALCVSITNAVTCSTPLTGLMSKSTETATILGYDYYSRLNRVVAGTSNMLYSLIYISTPIRAVIRKTDASFVQSWIVSFSFSPISKSLSVDSSEQNVFVASQTTPIVVFRISASTKAVNEQNSL